ncbi:MAG: FecR domain-containing protein [Gemmatimonadetes bacterium]|nr:FecR domain-containing protein [Gemmatimonadota bacterium]
MTYQPTRPDSPFGEEVWDVLARYVAGESPVPEAEAVRRWLAADPERGELVAALERSIGSLAFTPHPGLDVEAALRRVTERLHQPDVVPLPPRLAEHPLRRWRSMGLRAAAVLALVVGGTLVWRSATGPGVREAAIPARTYHSPVGRTDSIPLADGSRAILGPGSELVVAAGYGQPDRAVSLRGVALFEVIHDEAHPFSVRAGDAVIQDLGTTFAVHHNEEEGEVHVVVTAGSVLLQGTEKGRQGATKPARPARGGVVLKPGDRGTVGRDGRAVAEPRAATSDDLAWTRGRLLFDNASLARVRADLRRWYGVDLQVADSSLAGRHITASFAGEPIEQVLDVIGLALGARIERQGNIAVVRAR